MLEAEVQLHKMVSQNSAEIIQIINTFYFMSFREIDQAGFDLSKLDSVRAVLTDQHLASLGQ